VSSTQKTLLFEKIFNYFGGDINGKCFAFWGLPFKPNTDDIRDVPSRVLIEKLWAEGASVKLYDPQGMSNFAREYGCRQDYTCCDSAEDALRNSDALVVVTEWACFKSPDFSEIRKALKYPVIFDGRNLYDPQEMRYMGMDYYAIGRSSTGTSIDGQQKQRVIVEEEI